MNENKDKAVSVSEDTLNPEHADMPTKADEAGERYITVKYNKEIINLPLERAAELAQKGMKFEALTNELDLLKQLAGDNKKTVMQFLSDLKLHQSDSKRDSLLEKCGDDAALKDEVERLYGQKTEKDDGFEELKKSFPEIESREDLPESVLENAKLSGRALLDEFLRYRLNQEQAIKENVLSQKIGKASSMGSQLNKTRGDNPEATEFLKGLWRRN